jgi:hypothetical protein
MKLSFYHHEKLNLEALEYRYPAYTIKRGGYKVTYSAT